MGKGLTALILAIILAAIVAALLYETARGPSFKPDAYADYEQCVRNIPGEWLPGSMERTGAEASCAYAHGRAQPRP